MPPAATLVYPADAERAAVFTMLLPLIDVFFFFFFFFSFLRFRWLIAIAAISLLPPLLPPR